MKKRRELLEIEISDSCGDKIEVLAKDDGITVTVEEPWAGDTETGFGRHCQISLPHEAAKKVRDFLIDRYPVEVTEC
jgi:hypothetical protein